MCFAKRAKTIKNRPVINKTATSLLSSCQEQIQKLQKELHLVRERNKDLASNSAEARKMVEILRERIKLNRQAFAKPGSAQPISTRRHTIGQMKNINMAQEFKNILNSFKNILHLVPSAGIPLTSVEKHLLQVVRTNYTLNDVDSESDQELERCIATTQATSSLEALIIKEQKIEELSQQIKKMDADKTQFEEELNDAYRDVIHIRDKLVEIQSQPCSDCEKLHNEIKKLKMKISYLEAERLPPPQQSTSEICYQRQIEVQKKHTHELKEEPAKLLSDRKLTLVPNIVHLEKEDSPSTLDGKL